MKETGIIRRIDELGRIVIPKEIRKQMKINNGENIEIYISDDNIILKKYSTVKNIEDFIQILIDSIYTSCKFNIVVTDTSDINGLIIFFGDKDINNNINLFNTASNFLSKYLEE